MRTRYAGRYKDWLSHVLPDRGRRARRRLGLLELMDAGSLDGVLRDWSTREKRKRRKKKLKKITSANLYTRAGQRPGHGMARQGDKRAGPGTARGSPFINGPYHASPRASPQGPSTTPLINGPARLVLLACIFSLSRAIFSLFRLIFLKKKLNRPRRADTRAWPRGPGTARLATCRARLLTRRTRVLTCQPASTGPGGQLCSKRYGRATSA